MSLIVIKLGGSVVTYKNSLTPKPRVNIIKSLSEEILLLHKKGFKIILVHGSGSYGHSLAKKNNLTRGLRDEKSYMGFVKTTQSMSKLNNIILDIFEQTGIPALSLPPHSFITQTNGKLDDFDISIIRQALDLGFIPVLYGDPVIDKKLGCSILSGDTIATHLAKKLNAEKVIFLSDVDGVFDSNPKINKGAKLIPLINKQNIKTVIKNLTKYNSHDVSGEMKGKILSIQENLKGKVVIIMNGLNPGILLKALSRSPVGTMLHLD